MSFGFFFWQQPSGTGRPEYPLPYARRAASEIRRNETIDEFGGFVRVPSDLEEERGEGVRRQEATSPLLRLLEATVLGAPAIRRCDDLLELLEKLRVVLLGDDLQDMSSDHLLLDLKLDDLSTGQVKIVVLDNLVAVDVRVPQGFLDHAVPRLERHVAHIYECLDALVIA